MDIGCRCIKRGREFRAAASPPSSIASLGSLFARWSNLLRGWRHFYAQTAAELAALSTPHSHGLTRPREHTHSQTHTRVYVQYG